jgi:hypothetical protein
MHARVCVCVRSRLKQRRHWLGKEIMSATYREVPLRVQFTDFKVDKDIMDRIF